MIKRTSIFGDGRSAVNLLLILVIFLLASLSLASNTAPEAQPVSPSRRKKSDWFRSGGEDTRGRPWFLCAPSEQPPATKRGRSLRAWKMTLHAGRRQRCGSEFPRS